MLNFSRFHQGPGGKNFTEVKVNSLRMSFLLHGLKVYFLKTTRKFTLQKINQQPGQLQCIMGFVVVSHKETSRNTNMIESHETNVNVQWANCGAQASR